MPSNRFDPQSFVDKITDGKTVAEYKRGQPIFKQGGPADCVHYLVSGTIKETVTSETGREAVVGFLEPGDFFGHGGLDGGSMRASTATPVKISVVTSITNDAMWHQLNTEPCFAQLFLAYLLERNNQLDAEKADLLFNNTERRLAQKLLMLAHYGSHRAPQKISPEITQDTLAKMIGATRQQVNYFLARFRKFGFIKYNGGITVMSTLLAAVLQDKPSLTNDRGHGK